MKITDFMRYACLMRPPGGYNPHTNPSIIIATSQWKKLKHREVKYVV